MMNQTRKGGLQTAHRFQRAVCKPPLLGLLATLSVSSALSSLAADQIIIGSKKFTESYVLAEIAKRAIESAGVPVEHRQGMGGTIILWQALRSNQIGFYPEYTGTIGEENLKISPATTATDICVQLEQCG